MEEVINTTETGGHFDIFEYFSSSAFWNDSLAVSLLVSLIVFTLVLVYMGNLFNNITKGIYPKAYVPKTKKVKSEEPSAIMQALTDVVPIEE